MSQQFVKWLRAETPENGGSMEEVKSQTDDITLHLTSFQLLHLTSTLSMNNSPQRSKNKKLLQKEKSSTSQNILLQCPHNNSKKDKSAQNIVS